MAIVLTPNDRAQVNQVYPRLLCSVERQVVWGTLDFACSYDASQEILIFENTAEDYIQDSYEIRIDFNGVDIFGFPTVFEESGKIEAFSIENGISLGDLHVNDDGSCCLGIYPEYRWDGVTGFIRDKVISYFYWQSFYRMHGKEPWEGYSHGKMGIYEALCDTKGITKNLRGKGRSRNQPCPCGSGNKYKKCCYIKQHVLIEIANSRC